MTVPCPALQWPTGLLEVGPEKDPSILLQSVAEIGGATYTVMAIRIDPVNFGADLRPELPRRTYDDCQVEEMLTDLSAYMAVTDRVLVRLSTGNYILVMLPASELPLE